MPVPNLEEIPLAQSVKNKPSDVLGYIHTVMYACKDVQDYAQAVLMNTLPVSPELTPANIAKLNKAITCLEALYTLQTGRALVSGKR